MAKPGPRPTGRVNEVKVMLDDEEFEDVQLFMALNGIENRAEAVRMMIRRLCRGVLWSMRDLPAMTKPAPAISRPAIREQKSYGNCAGDRG